MKDWRLSPKIGYRRRLPILTISFQHCTEVVANTIRKGEKEACKSISVFICTWHDLVYRKILRNPQRKLLELTSDTAEYKINIQKCICIYNEQSENDIKDIDPVTVTLKG
jgi:hypothetical protein